MRSIKETNTAYKVNMGGIILDQALPYPGTNQVDPFLLIHHMDSKLAGDDAQQNVGVGPHPHRGFSPVTFIFKGAVHHQDSRGNNEIVDAGGVQWMNSGMGIVHSERPTKELADKGGEFEIIQLWINTPAAHKMDQPAYFPLQNSDIPTYDLADGRFSIQVVAGEYKGVKSDVPNYTNLLALNTSLKANAKESFSIPSSMNVIVYQLDGRLLINEKKTFAKDLTVFDNDKEEIEIEAIDDTRFLLLAGEPINEKVVQHGPFVMNTETQIMEAIRDYQMGKMGFLVEEFE